jgi:hypothetical protein
MCSNCMRSGLERIPVSLQQDRRIKAAAAGHSIRVSSYHPRDVFSQAESERQGRG